jgi:two-component system phosphate regulon sensor histidine kinase PhoR
MSFIGWARRAPLWLRVSIVGVLVASTVPLGMASIALSPPGATVAMWWPAAGISVIGLAISRARTRWLVVLAIAVMGFLANYTAGRTLPISIGYGIANAAEALAVVTVAESRGREPSLDRVADAARMLLGVLAGTAAIGILVGIIVAFDGRDGIATGLGVAASHGSAILLLVPLAVLKPASFHTDRPRELLLQVVALILVTAFVFSPGQNLPIAFVVFPIFVWATFRFSIGINAIQALITAFIATLALYTGGGPFSPLFQQNPIGAVHLVQLYIDVLAATALVLGIARSARHRLSALSRAREVVLLSGITASTVGFVILERDSGSDIRLAAANAVADKLLHTGGSGWQAGDVVDLNHFPATLGGPLQELIDGKTQNWTGIITAADANRIVEAHLSRVRSDLGTLVLTVQVEDVTAREEARLANERALQNERATVERLRATNRQQDDFVAAVSHELRTPLTSIIGFSDELNHLTLPDEAKRYLEVVTRNAERLSDLVEDLLEVARLTSQVQLRTNEKIDIDQLIANVIKDQHHAAAARSITVKAARKTGASVTSVRADVTRIITNLLSNAIKFSPVGGKVEIGVDVAAAHIRVRVTDNGPGISPDDLERVFERFYRASEAATVPGSGLGLLIARGNAEQLGGSIELESEVGVGTTAVLTLPRKPGRGQ